MGWHPEEAGFPLWRAIESNPRPGRGSNVLQIIAPLLPRLSPPPVARTRISNCMPSRTLELLTAPRIRLIMTWVVLLTAVGHRGVQAWINFRVKERPDGNDGHTSIDYGGQW